MDGRVEKQGAIDQFAFGQGSGVNSETVSIAGDVKVEAEVKKEEIKADGKLVVAEEVAEGRVGWSACETLYCNTHFRMTNFVAVGFFLHAFGGLLFWIILLIGILFANSVLIL